MSSSPVTVAQSSPFPWRRWVRAWAFLTFWLALLPGLVAATYYEFTKPSDFVPALQSLRADGLVWAVRVGSASCSRLGGGTQSTSFGVNAENPSFLQGRKSVWNRTLESTYEATYLAWFRGALSPTVFTLFRSVTPSGEISYGAWQNGSKPFAHYVLYCVLLGAVVVVFFEVVRALDKRKNPR